MGLVDVILALPAMTYKELVQLLLADIEKNQGDLTDFESRHSAPRCEPLSCLKEGMLLLKINEGEEVVVEEGERDVPFLLPERQIIYLGNSTLFR